MEQILTADNLASRLDRPLALQNRTRIEAPAANKCTNIYTSRPLNLDQDGLWGSQVEISPKSLYTLAATTKRHQGYHTLPHTQIGPPRPRLNLIKPEPVPVFHRAATMGRTPTQSQRGNGEKRCSASQQLVDSTFQHTLQPAGKSWHQSTGKLSHLLLNCE